MPVRSSNFKVQPDQILEHGRIYITKTDALHHNIINTVSLVLTIVINKKYMKTMTKDKKGSYLYVTRK